MAPSKGTHLRIYNGEVLRKRYQVIDEIGCGNFSKVYRCLDLVATGKRLTEYVPVYVAMKVLKKEFKKDGAYEYQMLKILAKHRRFDSIKIPLLSDFFELKGCCVFITSIYGPSLRARRLGIRRGVVTKQALKLFSYHILRALQFLHDDCHIVHTDLKPENILLENSFCSERTIGTHWIICDYGSASVCVEDHLDSDLIATRPYRPPEVILGNKWDYSADVWSVGCILFEVCVGMRLFEVRDDITHLWCITRRIGKLPEYFTKHSKYSAKFFNSKGEFISPSDAIRDGQVLLNPLKDFVRDDPDFLLLLTQVLELLPEKRVKARDALKLPYFDDVRDELQEAERLSALPERVEEPKPPQTSAVKETSKRGGVAIEEDEEEEEEEVEEEEVVRSERKKEEKGNKTVVSAFHAANSATTLDRKPYTSSSSSKGIERGASKRAFHSTAAGARAPPHPPQRSAPVTAHTGARGRAVKPSASGGSLVGSASPSPAASPDGSLVSTDASHGASSPFPAPPLPSSPYTSPGSAGSSPSSSHSFIAATSTSPPTAVKTTKLRGVSRKPNATTKKKPWEDVYTEPQPKPPSPLPTAAPSTAVPPGKKASLSSHHQHRHHHHHHHHHHRRPSTPSTASAVSSRSTNESGSWHRRSTRRHHSPTSCSPCCTCTSSTTKTPGPQSSAKGSTSDALSFSATDHSHHPNRIPHAAPSHSIHSPSTDSPASPFRAEEPFLDGHLQKGKDGGASASSTVAGLLPVTAVRRQPMQGLQAARMETAVSPLPFASPLSSTLESSASAVDVEAAVALANGRAYYVTRKAVDGRQQKQPSASASGSRSSRSSSDREERRRRKREEEKKGIPKEKRKDASGQLYQDIRKGLDASPTGKDGAAIRGFPGTEGEGMKAKAKTSSLSSPHDHDDNGTAHDVPLEKQRTAVWAVEGKDKEEKHHPHAGKEPPQKEGKHEKSSSRSRRFSPIPSDTNALHSSRSNAEMPPAVVASKKKPLPHSKPTFQLAKPTGVKKEKKIKEEEEEEEENENRYRGRELSKETKLAAAGPTPQSASLSSLSFSRPESSPGSLPSSMGFSLQGDPPLRPTTTTDVTKSRLREVPKERHFPPPASSPASATAPRTAFPTKKQVEEEKKKKKEEEEEEGSEEENAAKKESVTAVNRKPFYSPLAPSFSSWISSSFMGSAADPEAKDHHRTETIEVLPSDEKEKKTQKEKDATHQPLRPTVTVDEMDAFNTACQPPKRARGVPEKIRAVRSGSTASRSHSKTSAASATSYVEFSQEAEGRNDLLTATPTTATTMSTETAHKRIKKICTLHSSSTSSSSIPSFASPSSSPEPPTQVISESFAPPPSDVHFAKGRERTGTTSHANTNAVRQNRSSRNREAKRGPQRSPEAFPKADSDDERWRTKKELEGSRKDDPTPTSVTVVAAARSEAVASSSPLLIDANHPHTSTNTVRKMKPSPSKNNENRTNTSSACDEEHQATEKGQEKDAEHVLRVTSTTGEGSVRDDVQRNGSSSRSKSPPPHPNGDHARNGASRAEEEERNASHSGAAFTHTYTGTNHVQTPANSTGTTSSPPSGDTSASNGIAFPSPSSSLSFPSGASLHHFPLPSRMSEEKGRRESTTERGNGRRCRVDLTPNPQRNPSSNTTRRVVLVSPSTRVLSRPPVIAAAAHSRSVPPPASGATAVTSTPTTSSGYTPRMGSLWPNSSGNSKNLHDSKWYNTMSGSSSSSGNNSSATMTRTHSNLPPENRNSLKDGSGGSLASRMEMVEREVQDEGQVEQKVHQKRGGAAAAEGKTLSSTTSFVPSGSVLKTGKAFVPLSSSITGVSPAITPRQKRFPVEEENDGAKKKKKKIPTTLQIKEEVETDLKKNKKGDSQSASLATVSVNSSSTVNVRNIIDDTTATIPRKGGRLTTPDVKPSHTMCVTGNTSTGEEVAPPTNTAHRAHRGSVDRGGVRSSGTSSSDITKESSRQPYRVTATRSAISASWNKPATPLPVNQPLGSSSHGSNSNTATSIHTSSSNSNNSSSGNNSSAEKGRRVEVGRESRPLLVRSHSTLPSSVVPSSSQRLSPLSST